MIQSISDIITNSSSEVFIIDTHEHEKIKEFLADVCEVFGWDVNDLMTNTIGACLGFFAYKLILKVLPAKVQTRLYSNNINEFAEMIFFAVCTFIIMVTAQRWIVHGVLNIP